MLEVKSLKVFHGPIEAVHGINITVEAGKCVTLLGSNGAGKTSTISAIVGTVKSTGSIRFLDREISKVSIEERFKLGIALSPEGRRIFSNLTVEENLRLGGGVLKDKNLLKQDIQNWYAKFPILGERKEQPAGTLSGGEQQMLAIARALISRPKILLLDEPSLGLAPQITAEIFRIIAKLKAEGTTILLVEQNAAAAVEVSDYVYVLNNGLIAKHGVAKEFGDGEALMNELTGVNG